MCICAYVELSKYSAWGGKWVEGSDWVSGRKSLGDNWVTSRAEPVCICKGSRGIVAKETTYFTELWGKPLHRMGLYFTSQKHNSPKLLAFNHLARIVLQSILYRRSRRMRLRFIRLSSCKRFGLVLAIGYFRRWHCNNVWRTGTHYHYLSKQSLQEQHNEQA